MEITRLDVSDADARGAWYTTMHRAASHDRPHALIWTREAFELTTESTPYRERHYLQAEADGEILGVAFLELPLRENLHLAEIEVDVVPEHRRRGVGRALWQDAAAIARAADRRTLAGEVITVPGLDRAAPAFAEAMGCRTVHVEHHLFAEAPFEAVDIDPGYELVTWHGRCPDEHRAAYIEMQNRMNSEVPIGEMEREPVLVDEEQLASSEERLAQAYDVRVTAARHRDTGAFGGYSSLFVPHGADYGWQDDTLVMPEHRGHRLGAALKAANYAELPDGVRAVHTWTDPDNHAMYRTNEQMGFRVVEHLAEVEAAI